MTTIKPQVSSGGLATIREVPAHLRLDEDKSLDLLKQFVVPPRIKIVQPTSRAPFNERFQQGDIVALPLMQLMASYTDGKAAAFTFTPLMFFPEWCCWNPIESKGTLKGIRERSYDSQSMIAQKCRNPKVRKNGEQCPEMPESREGKKLYLRYLEHLNYILLIHGESEFANIPISITFASGDHYAGTTFNGLIQQRRAPLWGCNFQAVVRRRVNDLGNWFGLDFENPAHEAGVTPFVEDVDRAAIMRKLHEEFRGLYESKLLQIDADDEVFDRDRESAAGLRDAKDM